MSSLKDIMDVDVEPLESQAYRRSREAAKLQASLPPIAPSAETSLPPIVGQTASSLPIQRRRSNRTLRPASQPTVSPRQAAARRRSSATEEGMDYTSGYHAGGSSQASKSGSPSRPSRGSEPAEGVPVKYTPITGRVSKAKKGVPVHTCDICRPVKTFTRAEHLRRHQLSHQKPAYPCTFEDCERAFHRPDLLARHVHRHETQGEKAYKSEDPRSSRASSDASESRTPSLKVETPSQLPPLGPIQGSPTDSMTPRTSGSGESSMTASSYSTITGNYSTAGFLPDAGHGHKRSATDAQLPDQGYSAQSSTPGNSRAPGGYDRMTDQNTFSRSVQPLFEEPYAEGGNNQFSNYTTTPHLPLLRIPEENWVPGLSYNNSPWCSSASDSTYSAQSEGSRKYGRSGSIATLADWSATGATPHWSPHPVSSTPQDLRSPVFDPMLEQYDTSYVSPRMTPPLSGRGHHLDVPTSYGGVFTYIESVGIPALPTFNKPVAQHFPVSPSRIPNSAGLEITRTKGLVEPQQLAATNFSVSAVQPQFEVYVTTYWQCFHQFFPIVHKPTFDPTTSQILNHAIIAIGTQYHNTTEARTTGDIMNTACKKAIECCPNWDLSTSQAILLTEMFSRFRGRRISVRLSRHFEELYSRLLDESTRDPALMLNRTLSTSNTAETLLERFATQENPQSLSESDVESEWYQFASAEARQRLLSACFMFDVHQSMYHQQPRSKAIRDNSRPLIHIPCPSNLWDAATASEFRALTSSSPYIAQPLHPLEAGLTSQYIITLPAFTQALLTCWFAAQLPLREDLHYPNDFLPRAINPDIAQFMDLFPTNPLAHTYLCLYHTPLHSLLAIAGDTWVFARKITPPSAFHAAQACLKIWSTSLAAAQATHHACRILEGALSQPLALSADGTNTTLYLSDYWSLYVAALTCWAFGNRYQNSGSNSHPQPHTSHTLSISHAQTPTSRSSSTTPVDDLSHAEETRMKAMAYVSAMLEFGVEDLLTGRASVKADTQAVVEAVRWKLEGESVGGRSGLLVDACVVLGKIKEGGKGKWF